MSTSPGAGSGRRFDSVRKWWQRTVEHRLVGAVASRIGKWRVRLAAGMTGLGAFLAPVLSADERTATTYLQGFIYFLLAFLPVILIDGVLRSLADARAGRSGRAQRQSQESKTKPRKAGAETAVNPGHDGRSTFRGRAAELEELIRLHEEERLARQTAGRPPTAGPVLLLIHGMPGVGKSALAAELALRLAAQYPDGMYPVNFGRVGSPTPPAEILKKLLMKLGRPESSIPEDASERVNLFRSMTTGKKILFIFDAARNHAQVLQVLPTEPACAVIITSRRDLSAQLSAPSPRPALGTPPLVDALEILSAVARLDWKLAAEDAIELVELCGSLPLAIVSAAERVAQDGTHLRHVAAVLRPEVTRLSWLEHGGRGVRERFLSEYRRLLPRQQKALCLLTLVPSPTFVPLVLVPILGVDRREAENVMASLGAAQLLESVGSDVVTGLARYQFNPLVRLFAASQLSQHDEHVAKTRERLEHAYAELVDDVLAELHTGYRRMPDHRAATRLSGVIQRIAEHPEQMVRLEYNNLLHLLSRTFHTTRCCGEWRRC